MEKIFQIQCTKKIIICSINNNLLEGVDENYLKKYEKLNQHFRKIILFIFKILKKYFVKNLHLPFFLNIYTNKTLSLLALALKIHKKVSNWEFVKSIPEEFVKNTWETCQFSSHQTTQWN